MSSGWLSFPFYWAVCGTFLTDFAPCLGFSFLLLGDQRPELLIRTSKGIPIVLLASTLTGQWRSNDNYSSHLVSLDLAPAASRNPQAKKKGEILGGLKE